MGNYQSISLLSYSNLDKLMLKNSKNCILLYFAYDPFAQAYLNEVYDPIIKTSQKGAPGWQV